MAAGRSDGQPASLSVTDRLHPLWLATVFVLLLANPAAAEVADKLPPHSDISLWTVLGMVVGFGVGLYRPIPGGIALLFTLAEPFRVLHEITHPRIGPAILAELGSGYVQAVYAAVWLIVLAHLVGICLHFWLRRKHGQVPFHARFLSMSRLVGSVQSVEISRPVEQWMER